MYRSAKLPVKSDSPRPAHSATPFSPGPGLHRGTLEKAPGNYRISDGDRNASTFEFPLLYQELVPENVYDIMSLEPVPSLTEQIVEAARELERQGVKAIMGNCGVTDEMRERVVIGGLE